MSKRSSDGPDEGNVIHVGFGATAEVQAASPQVDLQQVLARLYSEGLDTNTDVVFASLGAALGIVEGAKDVESFPPLEGQCVVYRQAPPPSRSVSSDETLNRILQEHADDSVRAAFQRLISCLSEGDAFAYIGADLSDFVCAFVQAQVWSLQKRQEGKLPNDGLDFVFFFESFIAPIWLEEMDRQRQEAQKREEALSAEREVRLTALEYGTALKAGIEAELLEEDEPPVVGMVSLRSRITADRETGENYGDKAIPFSPKDTHPLYALEKDGRIFLVLGPREDAREYGDLTRMGIYVGRGQTREAAAQNLRECLHEKGYNCQIRFND